MITLLQRKNSSRFSATIKNSNKRVLALLSLLALLPQSLPAGAQQLPVVEQVTAPRQTSAPVPRAATASGRQVINGENLTAGQLNQIFTSGARSYIINTTTPISGDLLIPKGVTLIDVIGKNNPALSIDGNLNHSGRLIFTGDRGLQASLNANNILVNPGALISTLNRISLNINALGNIVNAGTISSSGNLNLNAGGSITNALQGLQGSQPVMQALQNINLFTGTGSITNSGLIHAIGGNVNIAAATASHIDLNNALGTIKARNTINFRDANYSGSADINVFGGNLLSKVLNLDSGKGTVDAFLDNITGVVNVTACNSHIGTFKGKDLNFGNLNVSDDPTYFNTGGNVSFTGSISTSGTDLAVLASGNVSLTGATINTSGGGNAGNFLVVAGADLSGAAAGQVDDDAATTITISNGGGSGGGSATGGNISISSDIQATGTAGGNGGIVQLIAYSGNTNAGTISLTGSLTTGANKGGTNGSVTILSGATSGDAITVDAINTTGSDAASASGQIVMQTSSPIIGGAATTIDVKDGTIQGGSGTFLTNVFQAGNIITTGDLSTNGKTIQLAAGGDITIGGNLSSQGFGFSSQNAGPIALLSGGNLSTSANGTPFSISTTSFGNGQPVRLVAGANIQAGATADEVTVTGASTSGGSINFQTIGGGATAAGATINTATGAATGKGSGLVLAVAFAGIGGGSGTVNFPTGVTSINTGTPSNQDFGGTVTVIAGATSGTSISLGKVDTRQGNAAPSSGSITIDTATPSLTANAVFTSGVLSGGSFAVGTSQASSVSIGDMISPGGPITVNSGDDLTLTGKIDVQPIFPFSQSVVTLQAAGTFTAPGGTAGQILITPANFGGTLTGGKVIISADTIAVSGTGPLEIDVSGQNTGGGGTVTITQTSATSLNIGSADGKNNIQITAASGATNGAGGVINLVSGGDLQVDTAAIAAAPNPAGNGKGTQFSFTAGSTGSGNLKIDGALNSSGAGTGDGGSISLISNSSTPFVVGGSSGNYINGTLTADSGSTSGNGGSVTIKNNGTGGVTLNTPEDISVAATSTGDSGTIDLEAPAGTLTIGSGNLFANSVGAGTGGEVTLEGSVITLPSAGGGLHVSANTGTITVTASGTGTTNIAAVNDLIAEDIALIATNGAFSLGANTVNGSNSVALVTQNSIDASSVAGIAATQNLALVSTAGDVGTSVARLVIDAPNLTAKSTSGNVFIQNTSSGDGGGDVNLVNATVDGTPYTNSAASTYSVIADGISSGTSIVTQAGVDISASNVDLTSSGGFALGGNITATNSIALISIDSILPGSFATASAPTIILAATGANRIIGINDSNRLSINAENITAQAANGSVFLADTTTGDGSGNVNLLNSTVNGTSYTNSAADIFSFFASAVTNDVVSAVNITADDIVITSAGGISTTGTLTGSNSVALLSDNSILSLGPVSTASLTLAATGTFASIGSNSGAGRLTVSAENLTATALATGSVWVTNTSAGDINGDINLIDSNVEGSAFTNSAGATYSVIASGIAAGKSIVTQAGVNINATDVDLTSTGGLSLAGNTIGTNSVALISHDSITSLPAGTSAPTLVLATTGIGSNIGTDNLTRLSIDVPSVTLSSAASVFVTNTSVGDINGNVNLVNMNVNGTNFTNSAAGTFSFESTGIASGKTLVTQAGVNISGADIDLSSSGGFSLAGNVTATASAALISNDSITSIGSLSAPAIVLATTGVGSTIGTDASTRLVLSANSLTAQGSSVFVTNTSAGDLSGNVNLLDATVNAVPYTNTSTGTFSFKATGIAAGKNVVVAATVDITAPDIVLTSSGGFSLGTANVIGSNSVALVSNDSITNSMITGIAPTQTLALVSTAGDIGTGVSNPNRILIDAPNMTAKSFTGNVFIGNTSAGDGSGDVNIVNSTIDGTLTTNSADGTYSVIAVSMVPGDNLVTQAGVDIVANNVDLTGTGFALAGNVSATNSIGLESFSSILSGSLAGVSAPTVALAATAPGANIGTGIASRVSIAANNFTAQAANGSVFLSNTSAGDVSGNINFVDNAINLGTFSNKASGTYSVSAPNVANNVTATNGLQAADLVITSAGGIDLGTTVITATNSAGFVGAKTIVSVGTLASPQVTLAATGTANIGTDAGAGRLIVDTPLLTASATGSGSVWVQDVSTGDVNGDVNLQPNSVEGTLYQNSAVAGTYSVIASGIASGKTIKTQAGDTISAQDIDLTSSGGFSLGGNTVATNSVAIIGNDTIDTINGITTPTLLVAVTGASANLGLSTISRLSINAANATLSSASGSVFVTNFSAGDIGGNLNLINSTVNGVNYTNSAAGFYSYVGQSIASGKNLVTQAGVNITAPDIDLQSSGGFSLAGNTTATNSAALISNDSITSAAGLSAKSIVLSAGGVGASLGVDASNRLSVSAANLTLAASSVFVTNTSSGDILGNVNLLNANVNNIAYTNGALSTFSIKASGIAPGKNVVTQVGVNIAANDFVFTSSGGFALSGNITSTSSTSIISNDSITSASVPAAALNVPTLVLAATGSGSSIGTAILPLSIVTTDSTTQASKSVFITNNLPNNVNLIDSSVEGVSYTNSAGDTFSYNGASIPSGFTLGSLAGVNVTAPVVELASGGTFALAGDVTGSTSAAFVSVDSITSLGPITTPALILRSTGGNIGTNPTTRLSIDAASVTANAANVWITDVSTGDVNGDVNLVNGTAFGNVIANSAGSTYSFIANGLVSGKAIRTTVAAIITGTDVDLTSSGTFVLNGSVIGGTTAALISNDSITTLGGLSAPTVILATTGAGADIGTNSLSPLSIDAPNVTISANGSSFVNNTNNVSVVLVNSTVNGTPYTNGANVNNGSYSLVASNASLSTGSSNVVANTVDLSSTSGAVTVTAANISAEHIVLTAPAGSLTIQDNNTNSLSAAFDTSTGAGGTVTINAQAILGGAAAPISITANGDITGTGGGGTVDITQGSTLFLANSNGNLVLSANAGQTALSAGGGGIISVEVTGAANTLSVDPAAITANAGPSGGDGGQLTLISEGALDFPGSSALSFNGSGNGKGGTIILQGDTITFSGSQNLALSVNGSGTGNGGIVNVTSISAAVPLTVDTGNGNFSISATSGASGGDGGLVTVTSGGSLTFDAAGVTANPSAAGDGKGASITMAAALSGGATLNLPSGPYTYNGAGDGDGGSIFFIGESINAPVGTALRASSSGIAGSTGNGGTILVQTASNLVIDQFTGITIDVTGGFPLSNAGNGGIALLSTSGTLQINPADLKVGPLGTNGNGGVINLQGSTVSRPGGSRLNLNANGASAGTGDGGSITIMQTTVAAQSIGAASTNNFNLTAAAGINGGNGGTVVFSTGGNLTVDPAGLFVYANSTGVQADGGTISLTAGALGTGNLLVTGALSANSAGANPLSVGGSITLQSNSKTAFSIKTGSTNGTKGDLSVAGNLANGSIEVINMGGGVTDGQTAMNAELISFTSGANGAITINGTLGSATTLNISLAANGTGKISGSKAIQAATIEATSGSGIISLGNINVSTATSISANTGAPGTVTITGKVVSPQIASSLDVSGASGKSVTVKSIGSISNSGAITAGTVILESTSAITLDTVTVNAPITASSGTTTLKGPGVNINSNVSSFGNLAITSKLAGLSIGNNRTLSAGLLDGGAPASPLPLLTANISKAASIILTSNGTGANALSIGTDAIIQSNGLGVTIKSTKANADLTVGNGASITANGGAVLVTSAGLTKVGLGGTSPIILARSLNNGSGSVTISSTGTGGVNLANGAIVQANKAITLSATQATSTMSIGNNVDLKSGSGGGTSAGALTINAAGTGGLNIGTDAEIIANAGALKITAPKGTLTVGDTSVFSAAGNTLTVTGGTTVTLTNLGATNGINLSGKAITVSAKTNLIIGDNSNITASGVLKLTAGTAAGNTLTIGDGAALIGTGASTLSSGGTLSMATNSNITNTGALTLKSSLANINIGNLVSVTTLGTTSANMTLTSKTTSHIGNTSTLDSAGKLTITNSGTTGTSDTGTDVLLTGTSVTVTSAGDNLTFGTGNSIAAFGASAGNIAISMSKSTLAPVLEIGDNFNFTIATNGSITLTGKAGGIKVGIEGGSAGSLMDATGSTGNIKFTASGPITVGAGTLDATQKLTISSTTGLVKTTGTTVGNTAIPKTITISGFNGVNLNDGSNLSSLNSMTITSTGTSSILVGDSVILKAGTLNGKNPTSAFDPSKVLTKGSIILTGVNQVNIGNKNIWTSNGGDIKVIAKTGAMTVGTDDTGNTFSAFGGNIQMLAKLTVVGADKNSFTAFAMGSQLPVSNIGGGIEIGSGLITSTAITTALGKAPIENTAGMALPLPTILNNFGTVQVNNKSGNPTPINLILSTLSLNAPLVPECKGGVIIFDAAATGSAVDMQNATFTTSAFRPIAMTTVETGVEEPNAATLPVVLKKSKNGTNVAVGNYNAELRLYKLEDGGQILLPVEQTSLHSGHSKMNAQIFARPQTKFTHADSGALELASGELFLNASNPIELRTELAAVQATKGALASVRQFQGNTYVRSCSERGTVVVKVSGKNIELNPGEELVVTDHKPDPSEILPEDGMGRRNTHTIAIGQKHVTVSDFAIITMLTKSDTLSSLNHSRSSENKHLIGRLLKTAAGIDLVLKHRGAYTAR